MDRSATSLDLFLADVSRLMLARYGLGWDDACGDVEPVERAWREGETAEAFVEWWAGKYALVATDSRR